MKERRRFLSAGQVAEYWGVHVETVYRAVRRGQLEARRFPTGRILIDERVAEDFAAPTLHDT
jgi:excisionase family DNA binding protein